jgi:hypothetical protein
MVTSAGGSRSNNTSQCSDLTAYAPMKKSIKLTYRDLTIVSIAAIAVTVCFSLVAGLVGNLQYSFAQEETILTTANGTAVVPVATTEQVLGELQGTMIAISGLVATALTIVGTVVAWIRSKTGDKIISNKSNEWLQDLFDKQRTLDGSVRDIFRQFLERSNDIDILVDVAKRTSPEFAKAFDENLPKLREKNQEVLTKINHWQEEADKVHFAVKPKDDPVGK